MVLWVDLLKYNMEYKEAFEEIYRFLRNNSSKYTKIIFTSKVRPKKRHIKIAMQNYASIENNQVLDIGADMFDVQEKKLVTKLLKTVDQNHELKRPNDVMKPQKRKLRPHMRKEPVKKKVIKSSREQIEIYIRIRMNLRMDLVNLTIIKSKMVCRSNSDSQLDKDLKYPGGKGHNFV